MAKATFGSGTSVMLNVGHERPAVAKGSVTALAWVHDGRPTYAYEGLVNYSSATISWLQNQLGLIDDAADSERMAVEVGSNGGVYLVPAFAGLSAPYSSPDARAAVVNMTAHTRKEHIVRAALESIAYQINDVLGMMGRDAGVAPRVLHADGGPTRNKFLMQFTADITGAEVVVSDVPDSSALGAAIAGLVGLGVVGSISEFAGMQRGAITFRRQMDAECVAGLVAGWNRAVGRLM
jgi:glycerol kinase